MALVPQRPRARLLVLSFVAALACEPAAEDRKPDGTASEDGAEAESIAEPLELSEQGLYQIALRPAVDPIPLGQLHDWILHVETLQGAVFTPSLLTIDGGMPQHKHGFVTDPRVTRELGKGDFLVEGVKFHMPGEWTINIRIVGPAGGDAASFKIEVGAG
jgi:hypothetical protein